MTTTLSTAEAAGFGLAGWLIILFAILALTEVLG